MAQEAPQAEALIPPRWGLTRVSLGEPDDPSHREGSQNSGGSKCGEANTTWWQGKPPANQVTSPPSDGRALFRVMGTDIEQRGHPGNGKWIERREQSRDT
jgi:hypothetical protein